MNKNIHEILYTVIFSKNWINTPVSYIQIKDLYSIDKKYLYKLNDKIIKKYKHVTKLHTGYNSKITNINHLTKLKVLCAHGISGLNDGIIILNDLEIFNASGNPKITNINNLTKLKVLNAYGSCGITDEGIINLKKIEILDASCNCQITNINHMTKIKELQARGICGINNEGIINLTNLEKMMRGVILE